LTVRLEQTVFILGGSADIGVELARRYLDGGCRVAMTYRRAEALSGLSGNANFAAIACDVAAPDSIAAAAAEFAKLGWRWDKFLSIVGTMEPIGPFFDLDFADWSRSITINAVGQLHALHALYPLRTPGREVGAMFMAGGGTNNPFTNYSAYAASKIFLIKMAELLDDEAPDLNMFVVGPGFVRTKIHRETLGQNARPGVNLQKTLDFMETKGTSHDDIFACIEWCFDQGRPIAGGRNFSVVHDPWRDGGGALKQALADDPDMYKMRRRQGVPAKQERS
jgi:NAD(P)-dependent dehydrogenase (short-subunit alcohol dehydrogenase family)